MNIFLKFKKENDGGKKRKIQQTKRKRRKEVRMNEIERETTEGKRREIWKERGNVIEKVKNIKRKERKRNAKK